MNHRVLLVNPPADVVRECYDTPDYPAIGIGYIAGYLKSNGIDVGVIDGKLARKTVDQTVRDIIDANPRVLGISAMTHMVVTASRIAQAVRAACPQTVIVLGGFHGTFLPERTLREFPDFDYVVVGEGEIAFLDLVWAVFADQDPANIQGVASRIPSADGSTPQIRLNGRGETPDDLDKLGMPAWELFPPAKMYPIMTQRGCPFACNFCSRPYGRKVRRRSPRHVVAELARSVEQFHCRRVDFYDETFTVRHDYVNDVCKAIVDKGLHNKLTLWGYVHANTIDLATARNMKAAGFDEVGFGVESGNPQIMKEMKKGVKREDVLRAARILRQADLRFAAYFIIGHPHETLHTVRDTIDLATRLNPDSVAFGIMTPYPGSQVWEMATRGEGGYKMLSMDWNDFNKQIGSALELVDLSRRQIEWLQLKAYITVYLRNLRFRELFEAVRVNHKRIAFILRKLIKPSRKTASASWLEGTGRQSVAAT
ncbi:MAG: B12-binding domain-containing radical SAM protein [Phycisphaerales bacterium]|nr:MAG: B12-binding domain-containing radical SAM protein [Phycisphaerales bacterium]